VTDRIDRSVRIGISFGLTSGVITTLGLLVGLSSGTNSRAAVVGGILTIAVADALSDGLGIHVSEESEGSRSSREVWTATGVTVVAKLLMALTFLVPVLALDLDAAVIVSIVWGAVALSTLSYIVAVGQGGRPWSVVAEHLAVGAFVVVAAQLIGMAVSTAIA
jgi:VIT1/CCC1 family predicted Fe2+/Mn2+ transporter